MDETTGSGFYRELLDELHDGVYFVDRDRRITFWNRSAERITGHPAAEALGLRCRDNLLVHTDELGTNLCEEGCPLLATMADGMQRETEIYLKHRDGHRVPVLVKATPIRRDGTIIGAVESFDDNTKRMAALEQIRGLEQLAFVDPLTELPNRRLTEATLRARFDELERYQWPFGVVMLDVDHFKSVNDALGHDAGDAVLRMIAQTLAGVSRSFDLVGRWGGEEFLAVVTNVDEDDLRRVAERYRVLVARSELRLEDQPVGITVTCGATLAAVDDTPESLLRRADELLYLGKQQGRDRVITDRELVPVTLTGAGGVGSEPTKTRAL